MHAAGEAEEGLVRRKDDVSNVCNGVPFQERDALAVFSDAPERFLTRLDSIEVPLRIQGEDADAHIMHDFAHLSGSIVRNHTAGKRLGNVESSVRAEGERDPLT